jgi:hypothetical protein
VRRDAKRKAKKLLSVYDLDTEIKRKQLSIKRQRKKIARSQHRFVSEDKIITTNITKRQGFIRV